MESIGLGGGCHWCTEAVFQSLLGVTKVSQGYIASVGAYKTYSEAIIVEFDEKIISIHTIIEIHLNTHQSTKNHSRRNDYRSAVYYKTPSQKTMSETIIKTLQPKFQNKIITKALEFKEFKASRSEIQNYFKKNTEKPFCKKYIIPKLLLLQDDFSVHTDATYMLD